jgi:hypothetical protein
MGDIKGTRERERERERGAGQIISTFIQKHQKSNNQIH